MRTLSEHERRLWARVARTVHPVGAAKPEAGPIVPVGMTAVRIPPTPSASTGPGPGCLADLSGHRRIRRGRSAVDARLDLHGMTQTEAEAALGRFIRARAAQGAACLLVITGKGRAGGGVLRARFLDWVNAADIRPLLSGYSQAHARHGGEGAYYLFIRSSAAAGAFHRGPT